jgi:hypothetical protein
VKTLANKSQTATGKLLQRCAAIGLSAQVIESSKPATRRYSPMGSTFAAQKVIIINCIRMSVGQAKQYIKAREKLVGNFINEVSQ